MYSNNIYIYIVTKEILPLNEYICIYILYILTMYITTKEILPLDEYIYMYIYIYLIVSVCCLTAVSPLLIVTRHQ